MNLGWITHEVGSSMQYVLATDGKALIRYWFLAYKEGITMKGAFQDFTEIGSIEEAKAFLESQYILEQEE